MGTRLGLAGLLLVFLAIRPARAPAAEKAELRSFLQAKTFFQTNSSYDPRFAIAVDAVVVHRHGDRPSSVGRAISSWKEQGYIVGRMFFADSDAGNVYWTGKWDGTPHPDDVERNAAGEVVKCAGVRPYMVPTEGWIRYLEEKTVESIDAGADAILPEEPLAHVNTGYEKSFQELWLKRYRRPWQAEKDSPEARFLTAQLKNELYVKLIERLAAATRARSRKLGRPVPFVVPIHSIYSNVAARLVAPLGTSLDLPGVDGYVGQIWTGPVNWALVHYDSPEKSFFASAYALYDYFIELVAGSGKRLWLLSDPVEDDPRHEWSEFETWYRHCVVAKLLFPEAAAFEVMPWPDRIFLPGHATGGSTPAPERYRTVILSAIQVEQEVPRGGHWCINESAEGAGTSEGIGVALADTLLWEREPFPPLQGIYGLLLPLVNAGIPASACILERSGDRRYLSRFRAIVLSYEALKPLDARTNLHLVEWVRRGGALVVLGGADDLGGARLWWRNQGYPSPLHHLMSGFGMKVEDEGERAFGRGWVLRRVTSPRRFGDPKVASEEYLSLVDRALRRAGVAGGLKTPGGFCLRRGPFLVAHATTAPLVLRGKLVDVLDPELPLVDGAKVEPGASALYRDVTWVIEGDGGRDRAPRVLHATHRLMEERHEGEVLRVVMRGPAETPAALRVYAAGRELQGITAQGSDGKELKVESRAEGPTLRIRFPNDPQGATILIRWRG